MTFVYTQLSSSFHFDDSCVYTKVAWVRDFAPKTPIDYIKHKKDIDKGKAAY